MARDFPKVADQVRLLARALSASVADNPTLMRLRELEALEKIAAAGHLNVMLGEKGLAERVVNLL